MPDGSGMNLQGGASVKEPKWPPEALDWVYTVQLTPSGFKLVEYQVAISTPTHVVLTNKKDRDLAECFPHTGAGHAACEILRKQREDYRRAHHWPPLPEK